MFKRPLLLICAIYLCLFAIEASLFVLAGTQYEAALAHDFAAATLIILAAQWAGGPFLFIWASRSRSRPSPSSRLALFAKIAGITAVELFAALVLFYVLELALEDTFRPWFTANAEAISTGTTLLVWASLCCMAAAFLLLLVRAALESPSKGKANTI